MDVRPTGQAAEAAQPRSRPIPPRKLRCHKGRQPNVFGRQYSDSRLERKRCFASARVQELVWPPFFNGLRDWVNSMPWEAEKISAKPIPNFQSAVRGYHLKLIV